MIQETRRTLASHTPVYFAGDRATDLFRVERGVVMVFNLFEDGRRQIVDFVTAGELLHFQFDGELDHYAEAITEVELVSAPSDAALSDPVWAEYIFQQMRGRLDRDRRHVTLLAQKS